MVAPAEVLRLPHSEMPENSPSADIFPLMLLTIPSITKAKVKNTSRDPIFEDENVYCGMLAHSGTLF